MDGATVIPSERSDLCLESKLIALQEEEMPSVIQERKKDRRF